jgi:inhibitor of cysteine peptidase
VKSVARITAVIVLLLALAVAACGGDGGQLELTAADSGSVVGLGGGDTVTITLDSNGTTGFQWNLVSEPDASVLELVASEYVEPEDGLVGEGGVEVWTFEAVATGETALELAYARPFEPDAVEATFSLAIRVR